MEEKFGTILIDGKLINLDNIPLDELEKHINILEKKETDIRMNIDNILKNNNSINI